MARETFEEIFARMELDRHRAEGQKRLGKIDGMIQDCRAEYDKLCKAFHTSKVVQGVSTAAAFVSTFLLASASDAEQYFADAPDIFSSPQGHVLMGVAAGGFALAGISHLVGEKVIAPKIDETATEHDYLVENYNDELSAFKFEESMLAHPKEYAIIHDDQLADQYAPATEEPVASFNDPFKQQFTTAPEAPITPADNGIEQQ